MINPRLSLIYEYCNLQTPQVADGAFISYSSEDSLAKLHSYSYENQELTSFFDNSTEVIGLYKLTGILKNFIGYDARIVKEDDNIILYSMDHRVIKSLRICLPVCQLQITFADNSEFFDFEKIFVDRIIKRWEVT